MSVLTVTREGAVLTMTLTHPPLNILTCDAMQQLARACAGVAAGDRLVVVRGAGKHFSAGADIGEHMPEQAPRLLETLQACFEALHAVPIPTLAVVRGACMGAGLELAAACDLMLTAEEAKLGVPEISLGVFPPIAAVDLPARIGSARAADLVFTGRTIDGRTAAAW
ncbi:MAG: enoyl-CoA hydratase/isomerase family protein, partial [Candidatus Brocadiae bacterium]|nr:enoyl-CoA hydratase/isomerase family protein [Candidatus Brocadiia bacterium]